MRITRYGAGECEEFTVLTSWKKNLRIGAWNTRTLFSPGRLDNAIKEIKMLETNFSGIRESRTTFHYSRNDRITLLQFQAKLINIDLKDMHLRQTDPGNEIERFYDQIGEVINSLQSKDFVIVTGYFNAKVRKWASGTAVGPYVLGDISARRYVWYSFVKRKSLNQRCE